MENENNKVNEPAFPYHSIRKSSFEDLENENRLYSLGLSPLERMEYLMKLNLNAFGKESLNIKINMARIYKP